MKKTFVKRIVKEAISTLILPVVLLLVVLVFANRDAFVTYEVDVYEKETSSSFANVGTDAQSTGYFELCLLPEDIYSIACEEEEICVYNSQNKKVYTAHARLLDFPENDRLVLTNRITSLTLNELLEIMEYIES